MHTRFLTTSQALPSELCRATSSSEKQPPLHRGRLSGAGLDTGTSVASAAHFKCSVNDPTTQSSAPNTALVEDLRRPGCGRAWMHIVPGSWALSGRSLELNFLGTPPRAPHTLELWPLNVACPTLGPDLIILVH